MGLLSQRGGILWETQVRGHSSLWWAFLIDIEISLHQVKRNFVLQALIQRKLSLSLQHTVTLSVRCFYLEEALRFFFLAGLGHFKHTGGLLLSEGVY